MVPQGSGARRPSGSIGVQRARRARAAHLAGLGMRPEHAVGHGVRDPVPVALVLEVVQPVVAPDRAVVARARAVGRS